MGQAQPEARRPDTLGPETPVCWPETPVWTGDSGQSPVSSPEGPSDCPGRWFGGRSGDGPETPVW